MSLEPITDDNREQATRTLVTAASYLERCLTILVADLKVNGGFDDTELSRILDKDDAECLLGAVEVVKHWKDYLEIRI